MTDVIYETKDGRSGHIYIDDGCPAIVYIREDGTLRVKRADLTPERRAIEIAKTTIT